MMPSVGQPSVNPRPTPESRLEIGRRLLMIFVVYFEDTDC